MTKDQLFRYWLLFIVAVTLGVLLASVYLEYAMGLVPCPLCVMQRICVLLFLAASISAFYFAISPAGRKIAIVQAVIAAAGLYFATRQLWLQSLPEGQAPACVPGIDVLVKYFPWQDVVHALFWGAGDCAKIDWQFLGIPISGWSAIYFSWMILAAFFNYQILRKFLAN